jgi:hypothetical protein
MSAVLLCKYEVWHSCELYYARDAAEMPLRCSRAELAEAALQLCQLACGHMGPCG